MKFFVRCYSKLVAVNPAMFCSGIFTCDVIFLTREDLPLIAIDEQVKISNHKMIVPSQFNCHRRRSYQYAEQIAVEKEEEHEDMLLSQFANETDLPDWYFIWFSRFDSFCFYQCVYFVKRAKIPSSLFRRRLCWIRSVSPFLKCLVS